MTNNKRSLLTSHHVNYMIYRYLQETGFSHTAFTFANESRVVAHAPVDPNSVPPGSLIALLQKGLQFLELEANLDGQDGDVDGDFKMLTPEELLTNDIDSLRQLVAERREVGTGARSRADRPKKDKAATAAGGKEKARKRGGPLKAWAGLHVCVLRHLGDLPAPPPQDKDKDKAKADGPKHQQQQQQAQFGAGVVVPPVPPAPQPAVVAANGAPVKERERDKERDKDAGGPAPMEEEPCTPLVEVPPESVLTMRGHAAQVYMVAWHPSEPLLASASGDATARVWRIPAGPVASAAQPGCSVLRHDSPSAVGAPPDQPTPGHDVTVLSWQPEGATLATACYDGMVRLWTKDGKLKASLARHKRPVFGLSWNRKGDLLASGSMDRSLVVWDAKTGDLKQSWELHSNAVLDVDWRNNSSLASCSTDTNIHLCRVGEPGPVRTWTGHTDEINTIRWDPSGALLVSCSDDRTVRLWSVRSDACAACFTDHTREVYTARWAPTGPGSANPGLSPLFGTASFDHTVRLWDVGGARCTNILRGHTNMVYSLAFSPDGRWVATGSFDHSIMVWAVADGSLVRVYRGDAGVHEVCWNAAGDKLAGCFVNNAVRVLDMRM